MEVSEVAKRREGKRYARAWQCQGSFTAFLLAGFVFEARRREDLRGKLKDLTKRRREGSAAAAVEQGTHETRVFEAGGRVRVDRNVEAIRRDGTCRLLPGQGRRHHAEEDVVGDPADAKEKGLCTQPGNWHNSLLVGLPEAGRSSGSKWRAARRFYLVMVFD
jgi:hypothetical protein